MDDGQRQIVAGEADAVARLVRGYLSATAVVVAVVTSLTLVAPGSTQMSRPALLVGAGLLLSLQVTGARLDWRRRLMHGRGQLAIDALVIGLTLVNSVQPMVSGPDQMTAWGIAVTVVFGGLVTSRVGMAAVMSVVVVTSAVSIGRFADTVEPVVPATAAVLICVLGALSAFAGRSFRMSLRERQATQDALVQRTLEVQQAQASTIDELRRLDGLKDDFISTASHELRTPLTVILGLADTLRRSGVSLTNDDRDALLERLQDHAGSLHETVTRVLDFDRLGELASEASTQSCDPGHALTLALGLVDTESHALATSVPQLPSVRGSEVLVCRVLAELVGNAVLHTAADTPIRVEMRHLPDADGPGHVEVRVEDDGPGIGADEFDTLVERFRRGGRYETRETRGLGLGLSFCAGVLTRMGSGLTLEPCETGTRLSFVLAAAPLTDGTITQLSEQHASS